MTQKFTVLFDLDGTLIDTAPDLMNAHNHVMQKFGYETKSTNEIRNLVGKGAASMIGRSLWNQARKELKKIDDEKIKFLHCFLFELYQQIQHKVLSLHSFQF